MRHVTRWMGILLIAVSPTALVGQIAASRVAAPDESAAEAARTKIREVFAGEYKDAKTPEARWKLAEQMAKRADDPKESPLNRFAFLNEARDLYSQVGDLLSSFRMIDAVAQTFDVAPFTEKLALVQKVARLAKTATQHRAVAIVALKLSDDAAAAEDYDTAKECCQLAVRESRSTSETPLQNRSLERLKRCDQLLQQKQAATDAQKTLADDPTSAEASLALGRYRCFARRDWISGLPVLRQSSDMDLAALATRDLRAPATPDEQTALAADWLRYAEKQKLPADREAAAERAAFWFETSLPALTALDKASIETKLETAYQTAYGRNFKKILARPSNGIEIAEPVDCGKGTQVARFKTPFDFRKSWLLSVDFKPRNLDGGWHQIFCWGDGRPGRDPLYLRQSGAELWACPEDTVAGRGQYLATGLPANVIGQWVNVKLIHDTTAGEFELYVNHRLARREAATIVPSVDRKMPFVLGGTDDGNQRFTGEIRKLWLGNF